MDVSVVDEIILVDSSLVFTMWFTQPNSKKRQEGSAPAGTLCEMNSTTLDAVYMVRPLTDRKNIYCLFRKSDKKLWNF